MFHCLQDRIPLRIQTTFEPWRIELVVQRGRRVNQPAISVGSVTSLEPSHTVLNCSGTGNSLCGTTRSRTGEWGTWFKVWRSYLLATYVFIFTVWDQDVHLGALGADDVAVQRVLAQVHLATVGLVDGDCRDSSQNLEINMLTRWQT